MYKKYICICNFLVGTQIDEAQKQFHLVRNTTESLYGEYLLKTQRLADTEVDTQLWKTHYQVLKEQVNGLEENEKELKNKLVRYSHDTTWGRSREVLGTTH